MSNSHKTVGSLAQMPNPALDGPKIVLSDMQEGPILRVSEVQSGNQARFSSVDTSEQEARISGRLMQSPHAILHTQPISKKS
jgi:hypothetical protein